ncbi:MAG: hypothetical protein JSV62_04095 [Promethearchaeota archaeon]|nr:MAG: hypothetical protein JSV62_04095 [Candidatus Lokiarchaeota archaeon]
MLNKKNSSILVKLKIQINNLISIYEQKAECGIFFKLHPEKSPLEILGVLDFLKEKIKKWDNTNLFSYHGNLFKKGAVLVVGARNLEEAISIIIYMYLSNIVDNESGFNYLIEKLGSSNDVESYLRCHISENIENGYPDNPDLELELRNHIDDIIYNQNNHTLGNF